MYKKAILNIDQEKSLSPIDSLINTEIEFNELEPITKELVGIIKTNECIDYKNILVDTLTEKYL
jgi:hypothetical protein